MGHKNADRVPLAFRRTRCPTIGDMQRERWDVISSCQTCGLVMRVDLSAMIRLRGPSVSLWNRKARCRRVGCGGYVEFQAKAPGMSIHEPLAAPE